MNNEQKQIALKAIKETQAGKPLYHLVKGLYTSLMSDDDINAAVKKRYDGAVPAFVQGYNERLFLESQRRRHQEIFDNSIKNK